MNKLETKQQIIEWLEKEIELHKEVEAETWNSEQQKLKDFIIGLESVYDYIHRSNRATGIDGTPPAQAGKVTAMDVGTDALLGDFIYFSCFNNTPYPLIFGDYGKVMPHGKIYYFGRGENNLKETLKWAAEASKQFPKDFNPEGLFGFTHECGSTPFLSEELGLIDPRPVGKGPYQSGKGWVHSLESL